MSFSLNFRKVLLCCHESRCQSTTRPRASTYKNGTCPFSFVLFLFSLTSRLNTSPGLIHSLLHQVRSTSDMYPMIDQARNPTPSSDSGYDGINEPYRPDDQLARTSTPGQLIQLLESKLAQGSNVVISLSNDEAEELIGALRSSEDASDRLPGVEQELVEAKKAVQELRELEFLGKYADYAGKVANDLYLIDQDWPRQIDKAKTYIADHPVLPGGEDPVGLLGSGLDPPLSREDIECAVEAYARRCSRFHSEVVYYEQSDSIGPQADKDLIDLPTLIPGSRKSKLKE